MIIVGPVHWRHWTEATPLLIWDVGVIGDKLVYSDSERSDSTTRRVYTFN